MNAFSRALLAWYSTQGRHGLPWQLNRDPYRIWVSEIMLQQTQVTTVIPYFDRFVARFPDVTALANASVDEVMQLWAGLGYYSRARNLHAAARHVRAEHGGRLPKTLEAWMALPGVGRSTAAAILALAFGQRHAILDGNCKRVYARYHGIEGWSGTAEVSKQLWQLAEAATPQRDVAAYTQAIMDLGATVCTRAQPRCDACPVAAGCSALQQGRTASIPAARPRRERALREATVLVITTDNGEVLLERRPPQGVWGGLWSLPELDIPLKSSFTMASLRHQFTHFTLDLRPVRVELQGLLPLRSSEDTAWVPFAHLDRYGLPAPVKRILAMVESAA